MEERPHKLANRLEQAMCVLDQLAGSKVDGSIVQALRQLVNDGAPVL
jgi:hypothetical protein